MNSHFLHQDSYFDWNSYLSEFLFLLKFLFSSEFGSEYLFLSEFLIIIIRVLVLIRILILNGIIFLIVIRIPTGILEKKIRPEKSMSRLSRIPIGKTNTLALGLHKMKAQLESRAWLFLHY